MLIVVFDKIIEFIEFDATNDGAQAMRPYHWVWD